MTNRLSRPVPVLLALLGSVLAVVLAVVLAGCGEGSLAGQGGAGEPGAGQPGAVAGGGAAGGVVTFEAPATAMRTLPGGGGLAITVTVPDGRPDCATDARAEHTADDYGILHVTTTVDSRSDGCPDTAERTVTLRVPVGGRDVALNNELWKPVRGGDYARCSTEVGCHPPADRCAEVWTRSVVRGAELPPEQSVDVLACDDGWLVLDIDAVVTGCQSVDGATPPSGCAGSGTPRGGSPGSTPSGGGRSSPVVRRRAVDRSRRFPTSRGRCARRCQPAEPRKHGNRRAERRESARGKTGVGTPKDGSRP